MNLSVEISKCDICGEVRPVNREYYYYDIACECCHASNEGKNVHFEIVRYCNKCIPKPPANVKVSLKLNPIN
jgi:hypothetical protein